MRKRRRRAGARRAGPSGRRRRLAGRRRRRLLLVFALIFSAAGGRGVVHAREVPFTTQAAISTTAEGARSVYAADVDGDGDIDTLSASSADRKIAWYENAGAGGTSWILHTISTTASGALSVHAADVDGDGDLDALSASDQDDKIAWYENLGGGGTSWTLRTISISLNRASSVRAADVDGDGDFDVLAASNLYSEIRWYENVGGGGTSWTFHDIAVGADHPRSVHAVDLDGDGDLDVVSAESGDAQVVWYVNVGGGGTLWGRNPMFFDADSGHSAHASDVDGDGDLDIVSAFTSISSNEHTIAWHENLGGGFWPLHTISSATVPRAVYAADVDGDGDLDVLAASFFGAKIAWHENLGGGTSWALRTIATTVEGDSSVYAADLDGDGDLDALSASASDDKIAWYRNDTIHRSATFVAAPAISTAADAARSVYPGDVDGDGDLDALSASNNDDKIAWYENAGGGTSWISHTVSTAANGAQSVHAADVDGDGDLDALSASFFDDTIAWYENVGGGGTSWTRRTIATTADQARSVYAADLDGDGDLDALSASSFDDKVAWYENVGGGGTSWTLHTISTTADGAFSVHAADVDGDGDLDVLSASYDDDKTAWYENAGGGGTSWTLHTISTTAAGAFSVYAADMDGDGDVDALSASNYDDKIAWYENVGGGTSWTLHTISTTADGALSVYVADVDADGDLDALSASSSDDEIAWYENLGGGTSWTVRTISTTADGARSVYAADVDGDGDLDAFSASSNDDEIAWYENRGGQFALATADTAPPSLAAGSEEDVLRITVTHRGRSYAPDHPALDHDEELATLELGFDDGTGAAMSAPLTTGQANALVETLRIHRDDGDNTFSAASDTLVTAITTLALTAGVQTVTFTDGDPALQVVHGSPRTYFVVLDTAAAAASASPNQLRVTHRTASSSTAENRDNDIPLTLEAVADASSAVVTMTAPADLGITKTDGVTTAMPGGTVTYTITASNAGPSNAPGSTVTDTFPGSLTCTWTCIGAGGGTCTGAGSGNLSDTVNLPAGGSVTYTAGCTVAASATGSFSNTATVAAPAGVADPTPGNNSATDVDSLPVIFTSGFETGDLSEWSARQPAGLVQWGTQALREDGRARFAYNLAGLTIYEVLRPAALAVVVDGAGRPLFAVEARRVEPRSPLELRLVAVAGPKLRASAWRPVAGRRQELLLEWRTATAAAGGGTLALHIDGRLALSLDGLAPASNRPAALELWRPDPRLRLPKP
jgi:uncharacterized repeat protein (TIGR01451 family)